MYTYICTYIYVCIHMYSKILLKKVANVDKAITFTVGCFCVGWGAGVDVLAINTYSSQSEFQAYFPVWFAPITVLLPVAHAIVLQDMRYSKLVPVMFQQPLPTDTHEFLWFNLF